MTTLRAFLAASFFLFEARAGKGPCARTGFS